MNTSEKIHPNTKKPPTIPSPTAAVTITSVTNKNPPKATATTTKTAISPPKVQPTKLHQLPVAPQYRPRPPPTFRHDQRRRRRCCTCKCCFFAILWIILIILSFLILATVTAGVFYAVYRPRPPSFSLASFRINQFNLTSPAEFNQLTQLNLSITTKNPNDKITIYYKPTNFTLVTHQSNIEIGQGYFPQFIHRGQNTTTLFTTITNDINDSSFDQLKTEFNNPKNGKSIKLKVKIESKVSIKIGNDIKTNYIGFRVICDGIKVNCGKNGNFTTEIVDSNCTVHVFFILFDWEIPI
ncbi:hypothetical protein vseg_010221 [Gypsophila vaccaria]